MSVPDPSLPDVPAARTPPRRRPPAGVWLAAAALAVAGAVWLTTLQTDVGGSNEPFPEPTGLVGPLMDDSGEFVVAWSTWGATHPPGYPLLGLLGNVLTRVLGALGAPPVAAASLVSWLLALGALGVLAGVVAGDGRDRRRAAWIGSASAILVGAFGPLTWLYGSVAEAYALALFLGFASVAIALRAGTRPERRWVLALGLVFGLAVGHHRTLAALAPALAAAAWPARSLGWRTWLGAAALAAASLGVYAYLPLAALAGSPWTYGRSPATLEGLLDALLAREYAAQLAPPLAPGELVAAVTSRLGFVAAELPLPPFGLALGFAGLAAAVLGRPTRRAAIVLALVAAATLFAPVSQTLLVGTHLPVMVGALALAGGWGLGLRALGERRPALAAAGLACSALLAATSVARGRPVVLAYTQDPFGRRVVAAVEALDDPAPTVVEAWGPRYFALAAGKWVTGELAGVRLVDARADLSGLPPESALPERVVTTADFLYLAGPEAWADRLGGPVALSSAGDGLVAIRRAAPVRPEEACGGGLARGSSASADIALEEARAWRADGGDVRVALVWCALARPLRDYHVAVKVSEATGEAGGPDTIAQGDRQSPVTGFYPTSRWRVGERVADDYRVPVPAGRTPRSVTVGLYTVDPAGRFTDHLRRVVPLSEATGP